MNLFNKVIKNLRIHVYPRIPIIGKHLQYLRLTKTTYEPGHYYSPVVTNAEIGDRLDSIFGYQKDTIQGITLNKEKQMQLLSQMLPFYPPPFSNHKTTRYRYHYINDYYPHSDAIFLYLVLRNFRPARVVEVGSGYSSAVMLDTNEHYLNGQTQFTFIEPFPNRLYSLLGEEDKKNNRIEEKKVQDADIKIFDELEENDILFIDSSHVSKTGSDVNYLLFEVLPRLKKGVLIHFHDVFFPFEYPKHWVTSFYKGFGWNEAYLLRSFLMYNNSFEIILFNTFLQKFNEAWFKENMPLTLEGTGGSIWIKKI